MTRTATAQALLPAIGLLLLLIAGCSFELPQGIPCETNLDCPYVGYCSTTQQCADTPGTCLPLPESCVADYQCPIHHLCIEDGSTGQQTCKRTAEPTAAGNTLASTQPADLEKDCSDGVDSDCDGQVDCEDADCQESEDCPGSVGDDDDSATSSVDCPNWCSRYMDLCSDADVNYGTVEDCLVHCEGTVSRTGLAMGTLDSLDGNTLGCRMTWLGQDGEAGDASVRDRCRAGWLLGGHSSSGYPCTGMTDAGQGDLSWPYCFLASEICNSPEWAIVHESFGTCLDIAAELPRSPDPIPPAIEEGDNLECRLDRIETAFAAPGDDARQGYCAAGHPQSPDCADGGPPPNDGTWQDFEGTLLNIPWNQAMLLLFGDPTLYDVTSMASPDGTQRVWVVGATGLIVHSNDGGQSWDVQQTPISTSDLYAISMLPSGHGWAVGNAGPGEDSAILYTHNWGDNWAIQGPETNDPVYHDVLALSDGNDTATVEDNVAVIFGTEMSTSGAVYKTDNGGSDWNGLNIPPGALTLKSGCVVYESTWRAVGAGGTMLFNDDTVIESEGSFDPPPDLLALDCTNSGNLAIATGTGGAVFHSPAPGFWEQHSLGVAVLGESPPTAYDIHIQATSGGNPVAWAVGGEGTEGFITYTSNPTTTNPLWTPQEIPSSPVLRAVTCIDEHSCWAVGEGGRLLTRSPTVSSGDDDDDAVGDDDDDAVGDDDDAAAVIDSCNTYCALRAATCSADPNTCDSNCNNAFLHGWMSLGTVLDTAANTLGCRIYHTGIAGNMSTAPDIELHCDHGNLFGGSTNSTFPCQDNPVDPYCILALSHCQGTNLLYSNLATCQTVATSSFPISGTLGDETGNTIQCRMHYLERAASDPGVYCPEGGLFSGLCLDPG